MPRSAAARAMRIAISPRLATSRRARLIDGGSYTSVRIRAKRRAAGAGLPGGDLNAAGLEQAKENQAFARHSGEVRRGPQPPHPRDVDDGVHQPCPEEPGGAEAGLVIGQSGRAHDQQARGGDACAHEPSREYSARRAGAAGREEEGRQTELRGVDRSVARIRERPDQRRVAERGRFEGDAAEHRHAEQRERDGEQASAAGGDCEPRLVARPGREVPPDAAEEPEVAEHREAGDVATDEECLPLTEQDRGDRSDRVVGLGGRPGQEEGDRHEDHEGDATGGVELPRSRAGHLAVCLPYSRIVYKTVVWPWPSWPFGTPISPLPLA